MDACYIRRDFSFRDVSFPFVLCRIEFLLFLFLLSIFTRRLLIKLGFLILSLFLFLASSGDLNPIAENCMSNQPSSNSSFTCIHNSKKTSSRTWIMDMRSNKANGDNRRWSSVIWRFVLHVWNTYPVFPFFFFFFFFFFFPLVVLSSLSSSSHKRLSRIH